MILSFLKIGNGTTWPGLIFEKYFPSAVGLLVNRDCKVILISGTNGKTTTRSMLVKIYEDQSIEACTNRGGANIFRGVAAALLSNLRWTGKLKSQNIILEVEEATMPILTQFIKPNQIILTNIFRDQMDAYGEIDTTLKYFVQTLDNLQNNNFDLIINKDDVKLLTILDHPRPNINLIGYGIDDSTAILPDYELSENKTAVQYAHSFVADSIVSKNLKVTFEVNNNSTSGLSPTNFKIKTQLLGVYNIYNNLAAIATTFGQLETESIINSLESVQPVFGRGEKVLLPNNSQIIMLLVKNPAGMNQVFELIKTNFETESLGLNFLLNDNIADGRDVSWLWDCNFEDLVSSLNGSSVQYSTSGSRGLDMLLRLETAGANVGLNNNCTAISDLVSELNKKNNSNKTQLILATYTAMLEFRTELGKFVELEGIGGKGN